MANQVTTRAAAVETALVTNNLAALNETERLSYYNRVCESLGLNPLTQPFAYVTLQGRMQLYAKKDCTDQLRKIHGVSVTSVERSVVNDVAVVTVKVQDKSGRTDEEIGAVSVGGLKGESLANALMKAVTKAKRRATLSICGLGWLDETELETIPDAVPVPNVEVKTLPAPPKAPPASGAADEFRTVKEKLAEVHRRIVAKGRTWGAAFAHFNIPCEVEPKTPAEAERLAEVLSGDEVHTLYHGVTPPAEAAGKK